MIMVGDKAILEFNIQEGQEYGAEKADILQNIRVAGGKIEVSELVKELSYAIPKKKMFKHLRKLEKLNEVRDNGEGIISLT